MVSIAFMKHADNNSSEEQDFADLYVLEVYLGIYLDKNI